MAKVPHDEEEDVLEATDIEGTDIIEEGNESTDAESTDGTDNDNEA